MAIDSDEEHENLAENISFIQKSPYITSAFSSILHFIFSKLEAKYST